MPTADFTLAQKQQGLRALYQDFQRSGLTIEEYYRRLQQATQPQMGPPAPAPVPTPPPIYGTPDVRQAQAAAFTIPPPLRPPNVQEIQAKAFNISPTLGTKEGQKAAESALKGLITSPAKVDWQEELPMKNLQEMASSPSQAEIMEYVQAREAGEDPLPAKGMYPPGKEPQTETFNRIRREVLEATYRAWKESPDQNQFGLEQVPSPPGVFDYIGKIPGAEAAIKSLGLPYEQFVGRMHSDSPFVSMAEAKRNFEESEAQLSPSERFMSRAVFDIIALGGAGKALSLAGMMATKVPAVQKTVAAVKEAMTARPIASGITEEKWLGRFTEQLKPKGEADVLAARAAAKAAKGTPEYAGLRDAARTVSADARIQQRAMQRAARAAGQVEGAETLQEGVGIISYAVNITKTERVGYEIAKHAELVKRSAQIAVLRKQLVAGTITDAEYQAKSAIIKSGELALKEGVVVPLGAVHIKELNAFIGGTPRLLSFEADNVINALTNVLLGQTRLLQPYEIKLIAKGLGPEVARTFGALGGMEQGTFQTVLELLNAPRAVATAYDLSASLRQAFKLAPAHPLLFKDAIGATLKVALKGPKGEKLALEIDKALRNRANYVAGETFGLYLAPIERVGTIAGREEAFSGAGIISRLVPGVNWSERTFITMLNKLRADVFDSWYDAARMGGKKVTMQEGTNYARYANWATGRGSLGPLSEYAPLLSFPLFAPRNLAANLEYPFAPLMALGTPRVAAVIAREQAMFYGTGLTTLMLAKLGGAEVELDCRSTDFGAIKIGNTRLDFWAGLRQPARVFCQAITGQRKDYKGVIYPISRETALTRGLWESKQSPTWQIGSELKTGRTFLGDPVTWKTLGSHFVPLFMQDVYDAVREWGAKGLAVAPLAFFGAGVQTYITPWQKLNDTQEAAAVTRTNPRTGQLYKNLMEMITVEGPNVAYQILGEYPDVMAAQKEADEYRKRHGGPKQFQEISLAAKAEQEEDDKAWFEKRMPGGTWNTNDIQRKAALVAGYAVYEEFNPDVKKRNDAAAKKLGITDETDLFRLTDEQKNNAPALLTAYFKIFERYQEPGTAIIAGEDKATLGDDIDRFNAQLTPEQQATIERNLGVGDSPVELIRNEDRQVLADAGYWDTPDVAWNMFDSNPALVAETLSTATKTWTVEEAGVLNAIMKASGAKNLDEYRLMQYQRLMALPVEEGEEINPTVVTAALARDSVNVAVGKVSGEVRTALLNEDPNLINRAIAWGWKTSVSQDLTESALRAAGLTLSKVNATLIAHGQNPIGTQEQRDAAQAEPLAPLVEGKEEPLSVSLARLPMVALQRAVDAAKGMGPTAAPPQEPQGAAPPPAAAPALAAPVAAAPAPTGGGTGGTATATGGGGKVIETPTGATSFEGIVHEKALQGITAEVPGSSNVWSVAHALAVLGGRDLATTPAGLPPDQLKAKLAGEAIWGTWIDPQTWQVVAGLGLQGKASLLPMFWTLFNAGINSTLEKTIRKDKDVQAVLLGLSHLGNATVEQYMRAFNAIVSSFTSELGEEEVKQSEKLEKQLESLQKKQEKAAKSAAKKAAAAAEKEAAKVAERDRWDRLLAELGR